METISKYPGMPSRRTIYVWLAQYPEFEAQRGVAREMSADKFAEEIIELADRTDLEPNDKKVRIWARTWVCGRLKPYAYGDRQYLAGDPKAPLTFAAVPLGQDNFEKLPPEERDKFLLAYERAMLAITHATEEEENPGS